MSNLLRDKTAIKKQKEGFTLIEVLLVIGILAILAAIVIVAVNPARQLAQANNTQRQADVTTILNAVYQYALDNSGVFPDTIGDTETEICVSGTATSTCAGVGLVTLNHLTFSELYLVDIPSDPQCPDLCTANGVGYRIATTSNGRIVVDAPNAQNGETISVTR